MSVDSGRTRNGSPTAHGGPGWPEHEEVVVRRGGRSGLPVLIALHSTVRGPALGGCRMWRYDEWRSGLDDALRLSAGMTDKAAAAGLAFGGGKTVVALPRGFVLDAAGRRDVLLDVGDAVEALGGRYVTGPDVGTAPEDMAVIAERTAHVLCTPTRSGDSSPHTAAGTLACTRTVGTHLDGRAELAGRRILVIGLGHVGELVARGLAAAGTDLLVSDIDPAKRALAAELGATWTDPAEALRAQVDIIVPAALGGQLTTEAVATLRCAAIVGPANNQLATEPVADALHARGVLWAPDYLAGAGGIVYSTAVEIDHVTAEEGEQRVRDLAATLDEVLTRAAQQDRSPHHVARDLIATRLGRD